MAKYVVGIDLGTTNTVVAFAPADGKAEPRVFPIAQLVSQTEVAERAMLPSCLFAPLDAEGTRDAYEDAPWIGGEHARRRSAEASGRGVASAKSWLSHAAVDRLAAILPWGAEDPNAPRVSPVDASARYLTHVRRAWDAAHREALLADQRVVLTVPASFDEVARELTLDAAKRAGLSPRLLEEPQAAFHDWLRAEGREGLAALTKDGREALVLVCDVGGGTTDLALVRVGATKGHDLPEIERVAVGRHVLLGGDNMDLALAHACERKMLGESEKPGEGPHLDVARFGQLVAACRSAKERLLAKDAPEWTSVSVLGAGSKLVGGTLSAKLHRAEVETIVLDGFLPRAPRDAVPERARGGLVAFGLPYERDVAITRHVAAFFARHATSEPSAPATLAPTAILLNGGVFRAHGIAARLVDAIDAWGGPPVVVLRNADPDLAVARGAVAHALAREHGGLRVAAGSPRGYYVEVAGAGGENANHRAAVCVVPRGAREGEMHVARTRPLGLVVGRPARFELYASDRAKGHAAGDVVALDDETFDRLPPIAATFDEKAPVETLRVVLEGELTEVGTLDLACVEIDRESPRRFRLAFALRGEDSAPVASIAPRSMTASSAPSRALEEALAAIDQVFGKAKSDAVSRGAKDLLRELERLLGERATWTTATARALFDRIAPNARARRRSLDHERVFWQLAGFCLRPGVGYSMDASRVALLAPLATERLAFPDEKRTWAQFWIAWRRVAAGLDEATQLALRDLTDPALGPREKQRTKSAKSPKLDALDEMLEMASSLERVPPSRRTELGSWILERTWTDRDPRLWAAIGRLGARVPAYASIDRVLPPHVVERWIDHLSREKWDTLPTAAEAAVRMARMTGDRARDLPERVRKDVAKRLTAVHATADQIRAVTEIVAVEETERAAFLGESLPVGLKLV